MRRRTNVWHATNKRKEGSLMSKMKDYVVYGKKIFIGLEDSKRTWKLCVRSEKIIIQEISMPARYSMLHNYLKKNYPECSITLIYEAGFKGFGLHDKLIQDGIDCIVTPPNKVTQEKSNRVKTDRIDARRLAKIIENGDYTRCHVPDKELREDRQISRTLVQIQKNIITTRNRIRKFLDFHGMSEDFPAGKWNESDYQKLKSLKLSESLQFSLNIQLDLLDRLLIYKKELTKKLKGLSSKERYNHTFRLFKSAPGIGWFTAIRLVLEWGEDLTRFRNGKAFASFVGLTSSEYSTGETIHRGRITKQSANFIRSWLIQCAWVAYKHDPVLLNKFLTVWKNSGSKKKAIVSVARKLAVRLHYIAVSQQNYSPGVVE